MVASTTLQYCDVSLDACKTKLFVHLAACDVSVTRCISCLPGTHLSLAFVGSFLAQSLVAELAVPFSALPVRDLQNRGWLCNKFRRATNLVKSFGHFESNRNNNNKNLLTQTNFHEITSAKWALC